MQSLFSMNLSIIEVQGIFEAANAIKQNILPACSAEKQQILFIKEALFFDESIVLTVRF